MEVINYKIELFDEVNASDEECHKFFDFGDKNQIEYDPDEPMVERSIRLKYLRDKHPFYGNKRWVVKMIENNEEIIIGTLNVGWTKEDHPGYEKNKSTGSLGINILKEYRQNGIGTKLMKIGMKELENHPEIQFIIPGSEHQYVWDLFEKYGGKYSSEGAENRMYMKNVDWNMIDEWAGIGDKLKEEGVYLQMFEICPDDILESYTEIYHETMNQQPLGEWDGEITITPESYRLNEKRNSEKGMGCYTLISREKDGDISGLTEIFHHDTALPYKGMQNLTGVREKYRGRGLGKWLKAEMLLRMKEKHPDWLYISTGNDETNAPMLSINNRMGFKQFKLFKSYKFDVKELKQKWNELNQENQIN